MAEQSDKLNQFAQQHSKQETTLINICYDCLERIFGFLNFESLLNVANTCKRLQIAAVAKFRDDFGQIPIKLFLDNCSSDGSSIFSNSEQIVISDVKLCFPFLRCFGAKITDLYVTFYHPIKMDLRTKLYRYTNQYCASTLTKITIGVESLEFMSESFQKKFSQIEEVKIVCGDLKDQLPNFLKWFPKLHRLEMVGCHSKSALDVCFPYLKQLNLYIYGGIVFDSNGVKLSAIENSASLLNANSHLQFLQIDFWCIGITLTTILDMISGNTSILRLYVFGPFGDAYDTSMDELTRFANEHPSIISIRLAKARLRADDAVKFIRQMKSLRIFSFNVRDRSDYVCLIKQLDNEWKHKIFSAPNNEIQVAIRR